MTIIEWFDPVNIEHLQAYKGISDGIYWPKDLLPKDIEFPPGWFSRINSKLANLYIEEKLKINILCNDVCTNCRWKDHCDNLLEELIIEAIEE